MGYALSIVAIKTYVPSADVIVSNDTEKLVLAGAPLALVKEIALMATIGAASKFRFHFEGLGTNGKGRIYRNDVAIGTDRTFVAGYTSYDEDINVTNFSIGDRLQVYASAAAVDSKVKNFRIEGIGSEFMNTLV